MTSNRFSLTINTCISIGTIPTGIYGTDVKYFSGVGGMSITAMYVNFISIVLLFGFLGSIRHLKSVFRQILRLLWPDQKSPIPILPLPFLIVIPNSTG